MHHLATTSNKTPIQSYLRGIRRFCPCVSGEENNIQRASEGLLATERSSVVLPVLKPVMREVQQQFPAGIWEKSYYNDGFIHIFSVPLSSE